MNFITAFNTNLLAKVNFQKMYGICVSFYFLFLTFTNGHYALIKYKNRCDTSSKSFSSDEEENDILHEFTSKLIPNIVNSIFFPQIILCKLYNKLISAIKK